MDKEYLENLLKNKDIIYETSFFESLKNSSLLEFRKVINMVQDIRPSLYIEKKVNDYYDELLKEYDEETHLFRKYHKLLEVFKNNDYDFLDNYRDFNYFISEEMIIKLGDYWHYKDRLGLVYEYLIKNTNLKISEIIVDGLFKDTIYNVFINIKEMLRYHKILKDNEMLLDDKKIKFYQKILDIDKMDNEEKLELYRDNKDKNVALMFYEDWTLVRKNCYQRIKDSLFRVTNNRNLLNVDETMKYNVSIYDLDGQDFYMMVRCSKKFKDKTEYKRNCYTLISGYNMEVFNENDYIYGYTNISLDDFLHMFERDAYSSAFFKNVFSTRFVNRIMTPEQLANSPSYSEIQIVNKKDGDNLFEVLKPNYLVVFDSVLEKHLIEAKRLKLPIVRIKTEKYLKLMWETYDKKIDLGFREYERTFDDYTDGSYLEIERRNRR